MNMNERIEGFKVMIASAAGFLTQMSNADVIFKAVIGFLTIVYIGGKIWKMFRDWNRKDNE